jgi:hypothetical protein
MYQVLVFAAFDALIAIDKLNLLSQTRVEWLQSTMVDQWTAR